MFQEQRPSEGSQVDEGLTSLCSSKSVSGPNELKPCRATFQLSRKNEIHLSEQAKVELPNPDDSAFPYMEKVRIALVKMLKRHLKTEEPGAGKLFYKESGS